MLGLIGAQRVGKTTLARAFAEETGIPFVQTSTKAVLARLGVDATVDMPLEERILVQREILLALGEQWEEGARGNPFFVTDRTPVDMAAYLLADVTRANCSAPITNAAVLSYVKDCIDLTNRHFSNLVLVQPGIEVRDEPGSARGLPAFQEHFTHLAAGLLVDARLHRRAVFIPREVTSLGLRVQALKNAIGTSQAKHQKFVETAHPVFH